MTQLAEGAKGIFEDSKPFVDYILGLGWGDKSSWENTSDKKNNEVHSESVIKGLKRPHVSDPHDLDRVQRFEEQTEGEVESEEDETRHRFSIAFEKSLVILGNMDNIKFFGDNLDLCLSSRYDDYFNHADLIARTNHDGEDILFSVDVTTSLSDTNLARKNYQDVSEIRYCPSHFKKRERAYETNKHTSMAANVMIGLSPQNALDLMMLSIKALHLDKMKEGLKDEEIERIESNIKFHPARVHLLDQVMQQVSFQAGKNGQGGQGRHLLENVEELREQVQEEGSRHSDKLANDKVCRHIERSH